MSLDNRNHHIMTAAFSKSNIVTGAALISILAAVIVVLRFATGGIGGGPSVAQNGKGPAIVPLSLSAVGRRLLRDCDQRGASRSHVVQYLFERLQFDIAEWTPNAAVEADDRWSLLQQFGRGDQRAILVGQSKGRRDLHAFSARSAASNVDHRAGPGCSGSALR